jgi:hypothetical protein
MENINYDILVKEKVIKREISLKSIYDVLREGFKVLEKIRG